MLKDHTERRINWWQLVLLTLVIPALIAVLLLPARVMATTTDVAMLQLLWVTWVAQYAGQRLAILSTLTSVLLLNLLFVEPYYTLFVHQGDYIITFIVMLLLGIFIARLSGRLRFELARAKKHLIQRQSLAAKARQAKMHAELEHSRAMMLRSLSHDLRTPLASIMGASSMLADQDLTLSNEQIREQASHIYSQASLLNAHFDKVMELSRVQQMQNSVVLTTHHVNDIISAAIARRAHVIPEQNYSVVLTDSQCVADATLVEIALANMLENAFKYGDIPVEVSFKQQKGFFELEVTNPIKSNPKIQRDSGHGLGTAICDAVMHLHQGNFSTDITQQGHFAARLCWPIR